MPVYDITCPECGPVDDVFTRLSTVEERGGVVCKNCGAIGEKRITLGHGGIVGVWTDKPLVSKQLGRSFSSAKELDAYCEKNNLAPVSNKSKAWETVRDKAREEHLDQIKEEGYHSREEKKKHWEDDRVERLRDSRKKAEARAEAAPHTDNVVKLN